MSFYYDDYSQAQELEEVGREYELAVAREFEEKLNCIVIPQGAMLRLKDGGIDLVAITPCVTYLIQCKRFSRNSQVYEKHVNQLSGSAKVFAAKYPMAKNITPILAATCAFSEEAVYSAKVNGIRLKQIPFQNNGSPVFLPHGEQYDFSSRLPEYENRLRNLFKFIQSNASSHKLQSSDIALAREILLGTKSDALASIQHLSPDAPAPSAAPQQKETAKTSHAVPPAHNNVVHKQKSPENKRRYKGYVRSETRLGYHAFLRFVVTPLTLINFLLEVSHLQEAGVFENHEALAIVLPALIIVSIPVVLMAAFFIGSFKFQKYAYVCVLTTVWFNFACYLCDALFYSTLEQGASSVIAALIWAIITTVYYRKRKPLFFTELVPDEITQVSPPDDPDSPDGESDADPVPEPSAPSPTPATHPSQKRHLSFNGFLWIAVVVLFTVGLISSSPYPGKTPVSNVPKVTATPLPTASPTKEPTPAPTATKATSKPSPTPVSKPLPKNGAYFRHSVYKDLLLNKSELTVKTPAGSAYYCIVLVDAKDPSEKISSVFVHPGSTTTVQVPPGEMLIYYTVSPSNDPHWYDSNKYFGAEGTWVTSDKVFDFTEYAYTLTLSKVTNGNWKTDHVNVGDVPFLE